MIINIDHIRQSRAIALNIDEISRLEPYITEAERLWVMPAMTAELYYKIEQAVSKDSSGYPKVHADNSLYLSDYNILIEGGYYDGNKKYSAGLVSAVAYLAYSRLLLQNPINVTAYGVVFKQGEYSEAVDSTTLLRASKEAEKIGLAYLKQCVDYLAFTNAQASLSSAIPTHTRRKFKPIGD